MVNNESAVQTWKKKCACKFADCMVFQCDSFNRCRSTAEYSAIQRTVSSSIGTNQEIMKFTEEKKKLHTRSVAIQVQAFWIN